MIKDDIEEAPGSRQALWRLPTVQRVTGLSRSSIYQLISEGKFPSQIRYHGRAAWVSLEVESWVNEQIQESRRAS